MEVRTRIAPSPTGFAHIGTAYQALFDYTLAKKYGGQFIVRIEDTDRARFVQGSEKVIFDSLEWFGLQSNEDPIKGGPYAPYRQSERLPIYRKFIDQLVDQGDAYYCFCSKERLEDLHKEQERDKKPTMYDKHCRNLSKEEVAAKLKEKTSCVVRLKVPENETIVVDDVLVGKVEFDSNLIDDQVILKSDGFPTYHLAVVVDDNLMKITHIIRGKEWLPSTPKHVLLYRFFGWDLPIFAHLPLLLKADGQGKLSKRDNTSSIEFYKKLGYLPEAILNYLSNVVWRHPEGKEIYSLDEFISKFELKDISSQGAKFDLAKLDWMNGEYIRKMSDEELTKRLQEYLVDHPAKEKIASVVPLIKERIKKLSDFVPLTDFLFENPEYDLAVFEKVKVGDKKEALEKIARELEKLSKPWSSEEFERKFRQLAESLKVPARELFQLIRVAVSGQLVTPPLFESIQLLGEEETLKRAKQVAEKYPNFVA